MSKTALVAVADGTEELEAVTMIDVLRRAGAEVTVAAVGELSITASRGVKLVADCVIGDCKGKTYDLIVLPGGLPGAEHLRDCTPLIEMLKKQKQSGGLYAAICASPAVALAPHGLLDDKQATGYPGTEDKLPKPLNQRVVVDGNCITSQGPGTALEFAIELLRRLFDDTKAQQVAEPMLFLR
ncbi:MAG: DJ-1 family glyoxalase III [Planctomycetota bacterium]|jgi:4-methyl-5(b-hydroxyethyl)-thiazole monophosphate biosynthesis